MKNYVKPVVLVNDEMSEGVYAASGAACYTTRARIVQTPEQGRGTYCIQIYADHAAADNHHSTEQKVRIVFNMPVSYSWSGVVKSYTGDGTSSLELVLGHHNNGVENNIGFGDLYVIADPGLSINSIVSTGCNETCEQHDGLN